MAGPAASVLVQFQSPPLSWRELMMPYASDWSSADSCGISDTREFGGGYHGASRPFVGSVDSFVFDPDEYPDDAALAKAICQQTNREFTHSIVVAAMCNQSSDHQVFCEVLIHLATRLDGIIDFDCLDVPPRSGLQRCEWSCDQERYWTTIGTPNEARIWLEHPNFHMLK